MLHTPAFLVALLIASAQPADQPKGKKDEKEAKRADKTQAGDRQDWETPKMEDVSEQVMAQPYIRFT